MQRRERVATDARRSGDGGFRRGGPSGERWSDVMDERREGLAE